MDSGCGTSAGVRRSRLAAVLIAGGNVKPAKVRRHSTTMDRTRALLDQISDYSDPPCRVVDPAAGKASGKVRSILKNFDANRTSAVSGTQTSNSRASGAPLGVKKTVTFGHAYDGSARGDTPATEASVRTLASRQRILSPATRSLWTDERSYLEDGSKENDIAAVRVMPSGYSTSSVMDSAATVGASKSESTSLPFIDSTAPEGMTLSGERQGDNSVRSVLTGCHGVLGVSPSSGIVKPILTTMTTELYNYPGDATQPCVPIHGVPPGIQQEPECCGVTPPTTTPVPLPAAFQPSDFLSTTQLFHDFLEPTTAASDHHDQRQMKSHMVLSHEHLESTSFTPGKPPAAVVNSSVSPIRELFVTESQEAATQTSGYTPDTPNEVVVVVTRILLPLLRYFVMLNYAHACLPCL